MKRLFCLIMMSSMFAGPEESVQFLVMRSGMLFSPEERLERLRKVSNHYPHVLGDQSCEQASEAYYAMAGKLKILNDNFLRYLAIKLKSVSEENMIHILRVAPDTDEVFNHLIHVSSHNEDILGAIIAFKSKLNKEPIACYYNINILHAIAMVRRVEEDSFEDFKWGVSPEEIKNNKNNLKKTQLYSQVIQSI